MKRNIKNFKKIVIKIGSSLISEDKSQSVKKILDWSKQIAKIKNQGKGVVIVATTSDNLIDKTGNIAIEILNKSKDLTFLTLNTASGSVKRLVGSTRRRKRRKGRRKKTRRNNRKGTRRRSQRGGS